MLHYEMTYWGYSGYHYQLFYSLNLQVHIAAKSNTLLTFEMWYSQHWYQHVLLVSLWLWSYGLALTSVGLQGPCWDVKGPRWLLSPPPSVERSISGRGYLPSMICFWKIRRPFQCWGSLLTCSSPPIPMNYAPVISWRAHTKGSPIEIWV